MAAESTLSAITVLLIAARAVNISGRACGCLRPRVSVAGDLLRVRSLLFDHQVVGMSLDDLLDLGHFMAWDDGEVGRVGSDRLVLGERQLDPLRTVCAAALTAEADPVGGLTHQELLGDLGHALVDLTEQGFVSGEAFFSRSHGAIVGRFVSARKVCCSRTIRIGRRSSAFSVASCDGSVWSEGERAVSASRSQMAATETRTAGPKSKRG
jgi:hypothetical protein